MKTAIKSIALVGALAMTGCGGGGGGSVEDSDRNLPDSRPVASVSGIAFDGLIIDGDVRVYDFTGATKGQLLGTGRTNGQGLYSVSLSTSDKPVLVEIDGGYYIEEATGVQVQVDKTKGRKMVAVEYYESGKSIELAATFFSTVATGLVEFMVHDQGLSTEVAIVRAYAQVDEWAGFDTRRTTPLDVSRAANSTPYLTDGHRYGFVPAGISQFTRHVGEATGDGVHDVYSSIAFIQTAYADVRGDGKLDGFDNRERLNFGNIAVSANTYRDVLAMRMLQFVRGDRNQTGLGFDDVLPFASQINTYAGELFGNVAAPDITESVPIISQMTPATGTVMSGTYPVSVISSDPYGISSIHVYVGDRFVVAAALNDQTADIDTRNFTNGNYVLRVEVTNFMGNTTSLTRNITINNGRLSLSVPGEQYLVNSSSAAPCPARFTLHDSTGTGVKFVKYAETVLLYESPVPGGSASLSTSSGVNGDSCRYVTANDGMDNPYSFALVTRKDRLKCDGWSGRACTRYEYRCRWSLQASC